MSPVDAAQQRAERGAGALRRAIVERASPARTDAAIVHVQRAYVTANALAAAERVHHAVVRAAIQLVK